MRCPFCSALEDRVVDTRPSDGDQVIRRRRECGTCNRRFTTYERIEQEMPLIVKKDGRREPYDRAKVLAGVRKACEKRPVSIEAQDKAIDEIERALQDLGEKEVVASKIGDAVLSALRRLDEVAYLRFASVYLSFKDLGELMNEVQRLMQARKAEHSADLPPPPPPEAAGAR
ncbi:MAG: transcriptional regulator NrdR [Myxococcales bacterium]|nr:transcriptional regulator NrdR [Myxococcales bacterium]